MTGAVIGVDTPVEWALGELARLVERDSPADGTPQLVIPLMLWKRVGEAELGCAGVHTSNLRETSKMQWPGMLGTRAVSVRLTDTFTGSNDDQLYVNTLWCFVDEENWAGPRYVYVAPKGYSVAQAELYSKLREDLSVHDAEVAARSLAE